MSSKDRRLAEALTELRDANLNGVENDLIGFVEDYFVASDYDEDDDDDDASSSASDSDSSSVASLDQNDVEIDEEPADPPLLIVNILPNEDIECNGALEVADQRNKEREFLCNCQNNRGAPCSQRLTPDEFVNFQCETAELTRGKNI